MRGRHFAATSLLWLASVSQAKHNLVLGQPHLAHEHRRHVEPRATFSMNVSSCPGYTLSDVRDIKDGMTGKLSRNGPSCNAYGNDIQDLVLEVTYESSSRLHVNIYDYNRNHFTVPEDVVVPPGATSKSGKSNSDFEFHYDASPFAFWVTRRGAPEDAAPLFDTRISSLPKTPIPAYVPGENRTALDGFPLVFEDAYLQIASALPYNANIYGLGEVVASSGIRRDVGVDSNGTIQTNWARDIADPVDENVYGVHPFYIEHRSDGKSDSSTHGVFLNSAAGADILLLSPPGTEKSLIEYRLIGGVLDFYFFSGPTPQAVVEQYSEVVGQPTWMPLWSFGNNLCRWGYSTVNETWDVVRRMKAAEIPLEVMWNDIDLYLAYRDFTSDPTSFSGDQMREFTDYLHSQNQYYIPIVDAAIPKTIPNGTDYYGPYEVGKELGVFITNPDGSEYIGQVWPGYTVFPDWFAPNTQNWWTDAMKNWSKAGVQFDGIWLDMNEASSFCDGSCGTGVNISNTSTPFILPGQPGNLITDFPECYNGTISGYSGYSGNITVNGTLTCDVSTLSGLNLRKREVGFEEGSSGIGFGEDDPGVDINEPPYAIKNGNGRLSVHALATNATHHGNYTELDTHNLWGTMEEMATHKALQEIHPGKRPFAISRSTFAGAGKFTGHWLGDNFSKWSYLHYSIQGVLQFQFFQIPMVGADACGFNGNTDEELCNRWMQLAAFTPFMRNHNIKGAISQEPYVWDSVAEASRAALHERYRLLPYWYSLFANASMRGTPPVRPLFFEFPNESELFGVDRQFLIGGDILVTPVLAPNSSSVTGYLPGRGASTWRDWFTHAVVEPSDKATRNVTLDAPLGHINVHIRDGSALLLFKEPGYTTTETSKGPYELLVHLASDGYAKGHAYVDDGISYPPGPSRNIHIDAKKGGMKISSSGKYEIAQKLEAITLLSVASKPNEIKADGKSVNFEYMSDVQKVVINGTSIDLNKDISFSWS